MGDHRLSKRVMSGDLENAEDWSTAAIWHHGGLVL